MLDLDKRLLLALEIAIRVFHRAEEVLSLANCVKARVSIKNGARAGDQAGTQKRSSDGKRPSAMPRSAHGCAEVGLGARFQPMKEIQTFVSCAASRYALSALVPVIIPCAALFVRASFASF